MKIEQVRVFIRVVDSGSFTKASRLLKQPISRVSRTIQNLEKELGTPLLYRTTRQLSLTQPGKDLYEHVRKPLSDLEQTLDIVKGTNSEVSGLLRITAIGDMAPLLATALGKFRLRYPRIKVEMLLDDRVLDLVKESIDISIRLGMLPDSSMKSFRLGQLGGIFVASPDYLSQAAPVESLDDLANHTTLYFNSELPEQNSRWKICTRSGKSQTIKIDPAFISNHTRPILHLALEGQGIAILPAFLCADAIHTGQLKRILRNYETKPIPVHLVWNEKAKAQAKVQAFIEFAKAELLFGQPS